LNYGLKLDSQAVVLVRPLLRPVVIMGSTMERHNLNDFQLWVGITTQPTLFTFPSRGQKPAYRWSVVPGASDVPYCSVYATMKLVLSVNEGTWFKQGALALWRWAAKYRLYLSMNAFMRVAIGSWV